MKNLIFLLLLIATNVCAQDINTVYSPTVTCTFGGITSDDSGNIWIASQQFPASSIVDYPTSVGYNSYFATTNTYPLGISTRHINDDVYFTTHKTTSGQDTGGVIKYHHGIIATIASNIYPAGIVIDTSGSNIYVADYVNHIIYKIIGGVKTVYAGVGGGGFYLDGFRTSARFSTPTGLAIDKNNNLYVLDMGNQRIRKIDAITGMVSTIAGTGTAGYYGDGFAATSAKINLGTYSPTISITNVAICTDDSANVYFCDKANYRIRKINQSTGIITTVIGVGTPAVSGDGGLAVAAEIYQVYGITWHKGSLYLTESAGGGRVRATCPMISTYSITGGGSYCIGGSGVSIGLSNSQNGIQYQLYNGMTAVGSPIVGTGSPISFGLHTTGTYTIEATAKLITLLTTPFCTHTMSGSAIISTNPLPIAYTLSGSGTYIVITTVNLSSSQATVSYQLYDGVGAVGTPVTGTGSSLAFTIYGSGTYKIVATTLAGCSDTMTDSAVVVILPATALSTSNTAITELSVYPNPFTNTLHIDGNVGKVQIYDIVGNMVFEGSGNTIEAGLLPSGVYIAKVNGTAKKIIKK